MSAYCGWRRQLNFNSNSGALIELPLLTMCIAENLLPSLQLHNRTRKRQRSKWRGKDASVEVTVFAMNQYVIRIIYLICYAQTHLFCNNCTGKKHCWSHGTCKSYDRLHRFYILLQIFAFLCDFHNNTPRNQKCHKLYMMWQGDLGYMEIIASHICDWRKKRNDENMPENASFTFIFHFLFIG